MKAIGTIVAILVIAIGAIAYFTTRPPSRELDAEGRAWVATYQSWSAAKDRQLERALVDMTLESEKRNARLIEPLRGCFASLTRVGVAPKFLDDVQRITLEACGRSEHAVDVDDRFGTASLATVKQHLNNAQDLLQTARRTLKVRLEGA